MHPGPAPGAAGHLASPLSAQAVELDVHGGSRSDPLEAPGLIGSISEEAGDEEPEVDVLVMC